MAARCIDQSRVLGCIVKHSRMALDESHRYSLQRFLNDLQALSPLIRSQIPPSRVVEGGVARPADMVAIVNAAWYAYLCEMSQFVEGLHPGDRQDRIRSSRKFQDFILKAIELAEIERAWREAESVLKR